MNAENEGTVLDEIVSKISVTGKNHISDTPAQDVPQSIAAYAAPEALEPRGEHAQTDTCEESATGLSQGPRKRDVLGKFKEAEGGSASSTYHRARPFTKIKNKTNLPQPQLTDHFGEAEKDDK